MRLLLPVLLLSALPAAAAEPIAGRFVTENGKAVVTLAPCGAKLCGRISRVLVPTDDGSRPDRLPPAVEALQALLGTRGIIGLMEPIGLAQSVRSLADPGPAIRDSIELVRSGLSVARA